MKDWCFPLSGARYFIRTATNPKEGSGRIATLMKKPSRKEKLRALGVTHAAPRENLYDVRVNLYRHTDSRPTAYGACWTCSGRSSIQVNPLGAYVPVLAYS